MSKVIYLDPSIATTIHIGPIAKRESVTIRFKATENWVGNFELSIFNSAAKNNTITAARFLPVVEKEFTLMIYPEGQSLSEGEHYYEIFNTDSKRIIAKGNLKIPR